jgi:hypothetical protein
VLQFVENRFDQISVAMEDWAEGWDVLGPGSGSMLAQAPRWASFLRSASES